MTPQQATQKQRDREEIARQVEQFLRRGGEIRVVEAPRLISQHRHTVTWIGRDDFDFLADRGI